jgi:hypothetical protein
LVRVDFLRPEKLDIWLIYSDTITQNKNIRIPLFFPANDRNMGKKIPEKSGRLSSAREIGHMSPIFGYYNSTWIRIYHFYFPQMTGSPLKKFPKNQVDFLRPEKSDMWLIYSKTITQTEFKYAIFISRKWPEVR